MVTGPSILRILITMLQPVVSRDQSSEAAAKD